MGKKISFYIVLFVFALDQLTKFFAVQNLQKSIELTSFFNLSLVYNKGVSFGMLNNLPYSNYILASLGILISLLIYSWLRKSKDRFEIVSLSLILGGALGNISDRFFYPGVVDFIELHWRDFYWPNFNIADSAIFVGICFLFIFSINSKKV